jgi:predicted secreted protein
VFNDARSKSLVFVAHCILNQNSISDGTASFPGCIKEILELSSSYDVGIVQMPCPELHCLGLDRGDVNGGCRPVVEENTRIRKALSQNSSMKKIKQLAQHIVFQIIEYRKYGFDIKGIVGINRSPSCGVDTTSKDNREVKGEGIFIEALRNELDENSICVEIVGIKAFEIEKAEITVRRLLGAN